MALLQLDESLKFLNDVLKLNISKTVEVPSLSAKATPEEKLSFLETVINAYLHYEPFQCISLMSQNISERHRPTWETIKEEMYESRGGLCYSLNSFMYALLAALGYEVSLAHATISATIAVPDNHCVILVHDLLTPDDLFLVDVGCGYYIPRAVPLNFDIESPEYTDSFLTYKFVKESENKVVMLKKNPKTSNPKTMSELHKSEHTLTDAARGVTNHTSVSSPANEIKNAEGGMKTDTIAHCESTETEETHTPSGNCPDQALTSSASTTYDNDKITIQTQQKESLIGDNLANSHAENTEWKEFFFFNPLQSFKCLDEFYQCFDLCYSDITKLSMHTSPRIMCWRSGHYVAVVHAKLITEAENGQLVKTDLLEGRADIEGNKCANDNIFSNLELLIQTYVQYFPQFPPGTVRAALRNWALTGSLAKLPGQLV